MVKSEKIVMCDVCGAQAEFVTGETVYGSERYADTFFWRCPRCGAYVGVHRNSDIPYGTLATKETREARKAAHHLFDQLWNGSRKKFDSRSGAYRWLAKTMDMTAAECHIGNMNEAQCTAIMNAVMDYMVKGEPKNETEAGSKER
jgi:hypothetical protein